MRLGESDRQIAKAGLMGRNKAAELRRLAEKCGWLNHKIPLPSDEELARALPGKAAPPSQASSVSPFSKEVKTWFEQKISGTVIYRTLQEKYGYTGSYSSVRRHIQTLKKLQPPEATVMLDHEPGDTAQVDFGAGPVITDVLTGEIFKTWFFVMTLAWSRHQYVEMVLDQKVVTWLGCHRRAFEFFGGVPAKVVIDNLKAAITKACWRDPAVQRSYADFAQEYGFIISPCPPNEPKKKGIVESGVKYVKRNFLPLKEFRSLADANRQALQWNRITASVRIHGTTKEQPILLFQNTEKHLLKALPDRPPEPAVWTQAKLHGNCHVQFEKSFYSAPFRFVRRLLWLQTTENAVKIFHDHQLIAVHPRARKPGQKFTCDDHLPPNALAYKMQDPQWCLKQADEVGPCCRMLIDRLFADRVLDNLKAAQGIVSSLKKKYSADRLEAACKRALFYDNPRYRTVKNILEKELDQLEEPPSKSQKLSDVYTGKGNFCRDANSLLIH
jgi:transposase